MKLNAGLNNCWSTPIYKTTLSNELCNDLVTKILMEEDLGDPMNDSSSNLVHRVPELNDVAKQIYGEYFKEAYNLDINKIDYTIKAWLTGTKNGYNMETHNHTGSQYVSVVYIMAEEEDSGGDIVLQDPRFNANRGSMQPFIKDFASIEHKPKTGDVLIMPGYVYHFVRPYMSKLRLAVPIDIFIQSVKE